MNLRRFYTIVFFKLKVIYQKKNIGQSTNNVEQVPHFTMTIISDDVIYIIQSVLIGGMSLPLLIILSNHNALGNNDSYPCKRRYMHVHEMVTSTPYCYTCILWESCDWLTHSLSLGKCLRPGNVIESNVLL